MTIKSIISGDRSMNKKKIFSGLIDAFIVIAVLWSAYPYRVVSKNIISKNNYKYEYNQVDIYKVDNDEHIEIKEESDKFINAIDELRVKSVIVTKDIARDRLYDIEVIATYRNDDNITCTNEVFEISLYKNKIIGFKESPTHKEKFYRIQDEKFKSEDFINHFKK